MKNESITKTALVCLALDHYKELRGRTRLQKILYFANISGWSAIKDYLFYQYGPYSEWVKDELARLVDNELVNEKETESYSDNKLYNYRLTPDGEEFTKNLINQIERPELIEKTHRLFDDLQRYSSDDLEIASSLVYLKKADPSKDDERLVKLVKLYKRRFSEEQIRKNLAIFDLLARYN